jgi:hypothetical protein
MNKIKKIGYLFSFILLSVFFIKNANAVCEKNGIAIDTSNGKNNPVNNVGEGVGDACNDVPDIYRVEFYRMSLCTSNPDVAGAAEPDLSSCVDMISDTGTTTQVDIQGTNESSLSVPEFTIPAGEYGFMVARLGARLGIKTAFQATTAVDSYDSGSNLNGAGIYCWTVNNVLTGIDNANGIITPFGTTVDAGSRDISNMKCSNAESDLSNAEFSYEVVYVNNNSGCGSFDASDGDRESPGDVGNGTAVSRMMKSATESAGDCTEVNSILWTIDLTTPLVVTDTSNFVMNFRTTDAVSIDFSGSAPGSDPLIVKVGADPIQAFLTVTD